MKPLKNIAHNRNTHIEFYVGAYVSMYSMWFKKTVGSVILIVTLYYAKP